MDYRLILSVLLVCLSWKCMGTYAQSNSTITPESTNATNPTNLSIIAPTVLGSNASTVDPSTAPARDNASVTGNATTTAATIPLETLMVPINSTDCGSKKLCVAEPTTCDPSGGSQCYFISAKQQSGQMYDFELSGESDGYIAAGLSTSSNEADSHQAYICANNNGTVRFFTGMLTNFVVNLTSLDVSNVKGNATLNRIQCTFKAMLPNTTREAGLSMSVSSGSYDPANGVFGPAFFMIQTAVVNLSDPNATISNLANSTNSTSGAYPIAHQQSLMMPALMLIVTILAFTSQ